MRKRREPDPDPLNASLDRIRANWTHCPADQREAYLAKLNELAGAWTGYTFKPVTPEPLPLGHPIAWADLVPYEKDQGGYWLYGTDPYGADKQFVRVPKPTDA